MTYRVYTRRLIALALALLLIIAFAVYISSRKSPFKKQTAQQTANVTITNSGFIPAYLTVNAGTQVTWTNSDTNPHKLLANPAYPGHPALAGLSSKLLNQNGSYSYIVTKTGNFDYHDSLKPTTNGVLTVR